MSLLSDWRDHAYGLDERTPEGKDFWLKYFQMEKGIYEKLLANPDFIEAGTVKELAEKYGTKFVDLQKVFDDYLKVRHSSYITWDRIHPSGTGCVLIAKAFFKALGISLKLK